MKKLPLLLLLVIVSSVSVSFSATVNKALKVGSRGDEVKALQQVLVDEGLLSQENVTGKYGRLTSKAVAQLQSKYGIKSVGYVGPQTLKVINNLNNTTQNLQNSNTVSSQTTTSNKQIDSKATNNTNILNKNIVTAGNNTKINRETKSAVRSNKYKEIFSNNKDTVTGFVRPSFSTTTNGRTKLIIRYKNKPTKESDDKVSALSVGRKSSFSVVPVIATELDDRDIDKISSDPNVLSIEKDEPISIDSSAEYANAWGVSQVGGESAYNMGYSGVGVKVAVMDTGIDYNHQDLANNYAGGYNFVSDNADPYDDNGHGTHVAGIIAASNNDSGVVGVAPNAKIYALKILNSTGSGYTSAIIQALDWAINNGVNIVNLSFGTVNYPGTSLEDALINAEAKGLTIIASAGNNGTCIGDTDTVNYPAKFASVISVGAVDKSNSHPCFSASGSKLDFVAPGVSINSTKLGGGNALYSGTSMATPHVAGTAATLIGSSVIDINGDGKINDEVKDILKKTATDLGTSGVDNLYGNGLVKVDSAINYLSSLKATTTKATTTPTFVATTTTQESATTTVIDPIIATTTPPTVNQPVATTTSPVTATSTVPSVTTPPVVTQPTTSPGIVATTSPAIKQPVVSPLPATTTTIVPPSTQPVATPNPIPLPVPKPATTAPADSIVPPVISPKPIIQNPVTSVIVPIVTKPITNVPVKKELPDQASDRAKYEQELRREKEKAEESLKKEAERRKELIKKEKEKIEEAIKKERERVQDNIRKEKEKKETEIKKYLESRSNSIRNDYAEKYKKDTSSDRR